METLENYKIRKLIERIQTAKREWNDGEHVRKDYSAMFYQGIYGMEHLFTGYISKAAVVSHTDDTTEDHFLSARLVFRALMDQVPELLIDEDGMRDIIKRCQHTIRITRDENNGPIKFKMRNTRPIIRQATIDKYDEFGWFQEGKGFLLEYKNGEQVYQPFPLKHMIPDWLTEFEKKYL